MNIAYSDEIILCLPPGCYSSIPIYLRLNNKSVSLMSLRNSSDKLLAVVNKATA